MGQIIFITGGARSGKSAYAENLAIRQGGPLAYIATAQALDSEMAERVRRHQKRRGDIWETIEEPVHLCQALARCDGRYRAILIDCITLWLTNLLMKYDYLEEPVEERIMEDVTRLKVTLHDMETTLILVTSEVGMGIVPENGLARLFRDIAGMTNQMLAAVADEAWLVASGLPLRLK
jgi:adenosylcobinamide kinase/adenosylcobinamide-phosphate guanylyltransferase